MKKIALIVLLAVSGKAAFAQGTYKIYDVPKDQTPGTVTKLGVAPQFASLRHVETADVEYANMKSLADDPVYGPELNNLFVGMGYTGVNDPNFGPDDLQKTTLPYGSMGMMGGRGNNYKYTILVLPNQQNIDAWKVSAATKGSDLYFLSACGNAFYHTNAPAEAQVVVREKVVKDYAGFAKVKVRVFARSNEAKCAWCSRKCESLTDANVKTVMLSEEEISQIPVTRDESDYPVKDVYINVDQSTFKKIKGTDANGHEYKLKANHSVSMN